MQEKQAGIELGGKRVCGLLFDMDGVLVESYDAWHALLRDAVESLGGTPFSAEAYRQSWGQSVAADAQQFLEGVPAERLQRYYEENFTRHACAVRVLPGVARTLEACVRRGIPRACVTNSPSRIARAILEAAGLRAFFAALVGADEVTRAKPAPDLVLEGAKRLGLAATDVALVGDTCYDVEAARAAGALGVLVETGGGADLVLPDLLGLHALLVASRP